ncbi:MAG: hypothetical protein QF768_21420 [Candidatus Latescibacteria bacterium]|nr:hypothetical protein [Candidatus Latescibacterota bacterium]MDP7634406.1 hypothetical protein [Candidatus Latescibacterota bacterium]
MDIELRQDGHATHDLAHCTQLVTLGVIDPLHRHRTVQLEQHTVEFTCCAKLGQQFAENLVEQRA